MTLGMRGQCHLKLISINTFWRKFVKVKIHEVIVGKTTVRLLPTWDDPGSWPLLLLPDYPLLFHILHCDRYSWCRYFWLNLELCFESHVFRFCEHFSATRTKHHSQSWHHCKGRKGKRLFGDVSLSSFSALEVVV